MNETWVTLSLGKDIECRVRIDCPPNTPNDIKQRLAFPVLQNALPQKTKNLMTMYADAKQKIDDYEYLHGRGRRWAAEQRLNELLKEYE